MRTGVFRGGEPTWKPITTVDGVWDAVNWGVAHSGWDPPRDKWWPEKSPLGTQTPENDPESIR